MASSRGSRTCSWCGPASRRSSLPSRICTPSTCRAGCCSCSPGGSRSSRSCRSGRFCTLRDDIGYTCQSNDGQPTIRFSLSCVLTLQKLVDALVPVVEIVGLGRLVPDQRAAQIRLWRHRSETQSGVGADDAVAQLVFGLVHFERLPENGQQTGKETGQRRIEDQVEQQNAS